MIGARAMIYGSVAVAIVAGWSLSYGLYQKASKLEAAKVELEQAVNESEAHSRRLENEIEQTNKAMIALRRDRAAINARFDALSSQLDEAVRNATEAQRACLALDHGDAIGNVLRSGASQDNDD